MPRGVKSQRNYYRVTVLAGEPKGRKWKTRYLSKRRHNLKTSFRLRDGSWMTSSWLLSKTDCYYNKKKKTFYVWDKKTENLLRNLKTRHNLKFSVVKVKSPREVKHKFEVKK